MCQYVSIFITGKDVNLYACAHVWIMCSVYCTWVYLPYHPDRHLGAVTYFWFQGSGNTGYWPCWPFQLFPGCIEMWQSKSEILSMIYRKSWVSSYVCTFEYHWWVTRPLIDPSHGRAGWIRCWLLLFGLRPARVAECVECVDCIECVWSAKWLQSLVLLKMLGIQV